MSFYENQHRARRRTGLLAAYFIAAVVAIVASVNLVGFITVNMMSKTDPVPLDVWVRSLPCGIVSGLTLLVILGGSLLRVLALSKGGGMAVAKLAGGTAVSPGTRDARERQLLNIVEEMAIASGTPVPYLFVLHKETGINAFVAGTEPSNTVLAVTRGALEHLTRDELQGVVGHEFSHILNGDMRLNIRLLGLLAGILLIGQIGEFLVRGGPRSRHDRDRKGQLDLMSLVGLALMVIGYVGLFFGRLIKAAISRQREFLADASAVQFTRNPDGIAGALYAIGQHSGQSLLRSSHAEDMSHLCIGATVKMKLGGLLATHPPLDDRIRAIDPNLPPRLKARFRKRQQETASTPPPAAAATASADLPPLDWPGAASAGFAADTPAATVATPVSASQIKASVGMPTPWHADYAHRLHDAMPAGLLQVAHEPTQADAVLYALILAGMRSHGSESLALVASRVNPPCAERTQTLHPLLLHADATIRLPLLDIALASLRTLDTGIRENIISTCQQLIDIDRKVTLTEFVTGYLIRQALLPPQRPARGIKSFQPLEAALATLFSAIVQSSGEPAPRQASNFSRIMRTFTRADCGAYLQMAPSPRQMTQALDQLNRLAPLLKQPVVDACVDCTLHDGKATLRELEVLRAICCALECPLPPVMMDAPC